MAEQKVILKPAESRPMSDEVAVPFGDFITIPATHSFVQVIVQDTLTSTSLTPQVSRDAGVWIPVDRDTEGRTWPRTAVTIATGYPATFRIMGGTLFRLNSSVAQPAGIGCYIRTAQ